MKYAWCRIFKVFFRYNKGTQQRVCAVTDGLVGYRLAEGTTPTPNYAFRFCSWFI